MVGGAGSFFGVCQKNGVAFLTACPLVTASPTPRLPVTSVSTLPLPDLHGR
jgi:hypothetical protein